ncbi:MAG: PA0069 family radical SAM protein [Planctomycetota bacterium]|nr:PA0069 family radical SAM protein [Planctomycetota bacterium]
MSLHKLSNPPNPWRSEHVEWLGEPPEAKLDVYVERSKSILSENDSPDIGFRWSVNPYRGCFHACAYCYARPTHQYLDFGAGTDFERKLVVKINAPELLRAAFRKPSWRGETAVFSGVTDCYQPLEASYGLTRSCLEVCAEFRNPVSLITKGALVRRDLDVLSRLHAEASAHVCVSLAFADAELSRALEPNTPAPRARLEALRALSAAGIPTGVAVAPVIPGVNDAQVAEVLGLAREAGATTAFMTLLRLPAEVEPVFFERLERALPGRVKKVEHALREMRGGELYRGGFHERMKGRGARWEAIARLFELSCRRLGMNARLERDFGNEASARRSTFRRPGQTPSLFE